VGYDKQKASLWFSGHDFSNNNTQYIKMYWGKSDANDNSSSDAVFDTANGFVGVWHLTPESGTDTLRDATINGFTLTNVNSTPITTLPLLWDARLMVPISVYMPMTPPLSNRPAT